MAWEHKEEEWQRKYGNEDEVFGWVVTDGVPHLDRMEINEWAINGDIEFTDWLDLHCVGGWEVLKISRDFNDKHWRTWVVFRKQA